MGCVTEKRKQTGDFSKTISRLDATVSKQSQPGDLGFIAQLHHGFDNVKRNIGLPGNSFSYRQVEGNPIFL